MTIRECPHCGRLAVACPNPCESRDTARRIAAALFACEGIDTVALEAGWVRRALDAARCSLSAGGGKAEFDADVLLVAALDALGMAPVDAQEAHGEAIRPPDEQEGG